MKSMSTVKQSEAGVISIFSVMFFIIFISIITVGFMKIISDEQQQAVNNDLSASALAAANSGVEEAKRVLLFCQAVTSASDRAACDSVLNNTTDCDALSSNSTITGALGITVNGTEGVVSENPSYLQRWTCLTIATETSDVNDVAVSRGQSELIPLAGVGSFATLQLDWHATASDREGVPPGYPAGINRISQPEWSDARYPAAMRVEIISHPTDAANLGSIDANTKTMVFFPSSIGSPVVMYTLATSDVRVTDPNTRLTPSPLPVPCSSAATYACSVRINFTGMPSTAPATTEYYARITPLYANTHVHLALYNSTATFTPATRVNFNNVQPEVDVTGRANDLFRRVKARVQYDATQYMPNYAIESGQSFCKDMLVTDAVATSQSYCP
jgi:Tfp pilus assembly protein PilX